MKPFGTFHPSCMPKLPADQKWPDIFEHFYASLEIRYPIVEHLDAIIVWNKLAAAQERIRQRPIGRLNGD